jgi:hypothetical protein
MTMTKRYLQISWLYWAIQFASLFSGFGPDMTVWLVVNCFINGAFLWWAFRIVKYGTKNP